MSDETGFVGDGKGRGIGPLAILSSMAAMMGALWVGLEGGDCSQCQAAESLLSKFPLAWLGVGFYSMMTMLAASGGFSKWTKAGFIVASGVHVVLLALLAKERLFCGGCVMAGTAALIGGVASLLTRPRMGRWALVLFAAACLTTLGCVETSRMMQQRHMEELLKHRKNETQPATIPTGLVRMVVYERPGCRYCIEFEERVVTPLGAAMGNSLEVIRLEAQPAMTSPSIELAGNNGQRYFEGPQIYEVIEKAIQEVR